MVIPVINRGTGDPATCAYCGKPRHRGVCKERAAVHPQRPPQKRPLSLSPPPSRGSQRAAPPVPAVLAEDGQVAEPMVPISAPRLTGPQNKEINVPFLKLSGHWGHADVEAASYQHMSPSRFSQMMKKRDPASGMTYREIFAEAGAHRKATMKRKAQEYVDLKNSAGAQILMFLMMNELGYSNKQQTENKGSVHHQHLHAHRVEVRDLTTLSDAELAEYAMGTAPKRLN